MHIFFALIANFEFDVQSILVNLEHSTFFSRMMLYHFQSCELSSPSPDSSPLFEDSDLDLCLWDSDSHLDSSKLSEYYCFISPERTAPIMSEVITTSHRDEHTI